MAGRIAGITIKIGGDTTNLQKSLKGVDSQLKKTQNQLKDVNRLLKLDPGNTELLTQKQKALESSIKLTKQRLQELKQAQSGVAANTPEWDALQREIIATEQDLKSLQKEYRAFGNVASQQLKVAGQSLQDAGSKVTEFGRKLAPLSGAAAALGGGLLKLGYDAVTGADDLNTLAKQTGFTTDEIQKMRYAADLIDVSFEDISGALRKFKTQIDPTNETLKKLGVNTLNADGSLRNATDVFSDAILALSGVANETERDQLAMDLFGKSADSLAGIIDDGGAALKAYGQQAQDLGLILDGDTLNSLNTTNDKIDEIKAQITATMAVIGAEVVPVVAPLLTEIADLVKDVTDKIKRLTPEQTKTILKVTALVAALAPLLTIGGTLISGLGTLISVIGAVVGVLGGPLTLAIGAIIAVGVLLYQNWDHVKQSAINLKDEAVRAWEGLKTGITTAVDSLKNAVTTAWDGIRNAVANAVSGAMSSINWLLSAFENFRQSVSNIWQSIRNIFSGGLSLPNVNFPTPNVPKPMWYASAYDNPVMFTRPTVLQTPQGLKGFGDGHGAEIVMGLNKLQELVGSAGDTVINIYAQPGTDVNALADAVQRRLAQVQKQKGAVYA